jgi:hypothetical protein
MYGEQNACYFYSRIKQDKVAFISHHFEKEPNIEDLFPEVFTMLNNIRATIHPEEE